MNGNENHEGRTIMDILDEADSKINRALERAESSGMDELFDDLTELEDRIEEIMHDLDVASAWADEGCPDEEGEEEAGGL